MKISREKPSAAELSFVDFFFSLAGVVFLETTSDSNFGPPGSLSLRQCITKTRKGRAPFPALWATLVTGMGWADDREREPGGPKLESEVVSKKTTPAEEKKKSKKKRVLQQKVSLLRSSSPRPRGQRYSGSSSDDAAEIAASCRRKLKD